MYRFRGFRFLTAYESNDMNVCYICGLMQASSQGHSKHTSSHKTDLFFETINSFATAKFYRSEQIYTARGDYEILTKI